MEEKGEREQKEEDKEKVKEKRSLTPSGNRSTIPRPFSL
jgi:hypothetical protein